MSWFVLVILAYKILWLKLHTFEHLTFASPFLYFSFGHSRNEYLACPSIYLYSVLKFQPEWGVYSFCISPLFLSLRCEQCANSGCVWPTWFIWYWSFIYWNYCSRSSSHPSHLVLVSWEKRIAIGGGGYHSCGSVHVYGPFIFLPEIYFGSTILDICSSSSSLMLKAVNKLYFGFIYTWDIFFVVVSVVGESCAFSLVFVHFPRRPSVDGCCELGTYFHRAFMSSLFLNFFF